MHSKEKSWRSLIWVSVLAPVGGWLVLVGVSALFFPAETAKALSEIDWLSPQPYLVALLLACIWAPTLIFALPMHHHEQLRRRAMAGDSMAMPLAAAQPKQPTSGDIPDEPIELRWTKWGRASSVTATSACIVGHRAPRKDVALPWDAITLIERWWDTSRSTGYCVYGNDGRFIEWPDRSNFTTRIIAPAPEVIGQRQDALLARVTTRTGLPIHTLIAVLAVPKAAPQRAQPLYNLLIALGIMLMLTMWIGMAILIVLLPLTSAPILNVYTAAIAILIGVLPLLNWMRTDHTPLPHPSVGLLSPPVAVPPDTTVAVSVPFTRNDLLRVVLVGILPLTVIFPLIRGWRELQVSHPASENLFLLHSALLMYVASIIMIGIGILLGAMLPYVTGTNIVQADARGVRQGRGKGQHYILWHDITTVTAERQPGTTVEAFVLTSASQTITWPANGRWMQPPEGAAADNAGAQFAAIVAERAGVQPVTRWE